MYTINFLVLVVFHCIHYLVFYGKVILPGYIRLVYRTVHITIINSTSITLNYTQVAYRMILACSIHCACTVRTFPIQSCNILMFVYTHVQKKYAHKCMTYEIVQNYVTQRFNILYTQQEQDRVLTKSFNPEILYSYWISIVKPFLRFL